MKKSVLVLFFLLTPIIALAQNVHKGKVLESYSVENYTYMLIDQSGSKVWLASPEMDVKVGDEVETSFGILMADFKSKSLNRTFDEIYFVTVATNLSAKKTPAPEKPVEHPKVPPVAQGTKDIPSVKGAITLKELFDKKDKLKGKDVVIAGEVTKITRGIMGHNWLHITDKSGKEKKLDLTVTSKDDAETGDVVKITGIVSVDKDFGAGYFFKVIIEGAKVEQIKY